MNKNAASTSKNVHTIFVTCCSICNEQFPSYEVLKIHLQEVHECTDLSMLNIEITDSENVSRQEQGSGTPIFEIEKYAWIIVLYSIVRTFN